MRKALLSLLVLALACPAFAAVNIVASDEGDGVLKLWYEVTADEVVRGIALKLEVASGDAAIAGTAAAAVLEGGFNTFIDYAFTVESGAPGTYAIGAGHPLAKADEAGALPDEAASVFSISMGALDQSGNQGGVTGSGGMITIAYALTEDSVVSISLDTLRGGIVGDNITEVNVQTSQTLVAGGAICLGDINGDGVIDLFNDALTLILALDANGYADITPVPAELVAGDMNGDGVIDLFNDALTLILMLDANGYADIACP